MKAALWIVFGLLALGGQFFIFYTLWQVIGWVVIVFAVAALTAGYFWQKPKGGPPTEFYDDYDNVG